MKILTHSLALIAIFISLAEAQVSNSIQPNTPITPPNQVTLRIQNTTNQPVTLYDNQENGCLVITPVQGADNNILAGQTKDFTIKSTQMICTPWRYQDIAIKQTATNKEQEFRIIDSEDSDTANWGYTHERGDLNVSVPNRDVDNQGVVTITINP